LTSSRAPSAAVRANSASAARIATVSVRAHRHHREIFVVLELVVDPDRREADRHFVVRHDGGHGRRHEVGAVGAEQQVDFVQSNQLGVDGRDVPRRALIIVDDKLDRTAEHASFGVHVIAPHLERRVDHFAWRRTGARQCKAEPNPDRLWSLRRRARQSHCAHRDRRGG